MEKQDEGMELERGLEIIHDTIRNVNMRLGAKGIKLEAKLKIKRLRLLEALVAASPERNPSSSAQNQESSSQSARTD